jgi:S1-C subfamily serine protease
LKYVALFLFALTACAATSTNTPSTTIPSWDATKPVERAVHSTVLVQTLSGRTFCSGTIVKGTGLILSAYHCFDDDRDFRLVGLHGAYHADVVAKDERNDIAILRPYDVDIRHRDGVPLARKPGRMGDRVFALGHAKGDSFPFTLTDGIISFPRRDDNGVYVQSTTPLVGGMSGGGFYNDRGELLGANLFVWLAPTYCNIGCSGIYQDSPMYGFSYLPLVKAALKAAH